jgi:manganese oxidase
MGHDVKNFIGVQKRDLVKAVRKLVPDYMPMGSAGMAEMGDMEMPMPDNTLPMMTGFGQFGAIEMGGMFTLMKVREGLTPNDYRDPGAYKHPPGTVAYEVQGPAAGEPKRPTGGQQSGGAAGAAKAVKPGRGRPTHSHHSP